MAEHTLRLKATLDSKEVQAELNKLRQMQQQTLGNGTGSGASGQANQNIQNLNSTLGKLNSSISNLQKTIDRMNANAAKHNIRNKSGLGDSGKKDEFLGPASKNLIRATLVSYGIGEIGNALKQYYTNVGDQKSLDTAKKIGYLTEAAKWGVDGAMIGSRFGPKGAVIGAAVGAGAGFGSAYMQNLATDAKNAAEALKKFTDEIEKARQFDKQIKDYFTTSQFNDQLKQIQEKYNPDSGKTVDELARMKIRTSKEAEDRASVYGEGAKKLDVDIMKYKSQIALAEADVQSGPFTKYRWQDAQGNYHDTTSYEDVKRAQKSLTELLFDAEKDPEENADIIQKIKRDLKNIDGIIKTAGDKFNNLNRLRSEMEKLETQKKGLEQKQFQEIQRSVQLEEQLNNEKKQAGRTLKDLDNQDIALQNTRDIAATGSSRMTFDTLKEKYNSYLDKYESGKQDYRSAILSAQNAGSSEEYKTAMEEAAAIQKQMNFDEGQANAFGSEVVQRLQEQLRSLKAPDLGNVGSLASQGFMTNKAVDQQKLDAQIEYQKQQTEIQREIKNKMDSLDTSSKFS